MSHGGTPISPISSSEKTEDNTSVVDELIRKGKSFSGRERNCSFLNLRNGKFADISPVSGLDFPDDGRAVARVDWDQDGDLDFWIVNRSGPQIRFLRNDVPQKNNFLVVRLQGRTCNRDAIGARAELYLKGQTAPLISTLSAGDGFLAQSSKALHFGLGDAKEIDKLVVRWPGGKAEEFTDLKINGHYDVTQQSGQAILRLPRPSLALQSSTLTKPPTTDQVQVLSKSKTPIPWIDYVSFDGKRHSLIESNKGQSVQPILLNLWASWCPNCQAELKEWTARANDLKSAGIRVVAISVDGLDGNESTSWTSAQKLVQQLNVPFETGMASNHTVEKLQMLHDHVFDIHLPLPVPTSFLIDPRGKLAAVYKGKVDVDQLLTDLQKLKSGSASKAFAFQGRWLVKRKNHSPMALVWKMVEKGFLNESLEYIERNNAQLAQHFEYHKLLALTGNTCLARGQAKKATELYRKALKAVPNFVEAQNNLAWVLATHADAQIRNGKEALRLANSIIQKKGEVPSYLDTQAAAYAEVGRFPEAVATAKKAVEIASSQGDTQMAKDIQSRIPNYQSAKPWRDK